MHILKSVKGASLADGKEQRVAVVAAVIGRREDERILIVRRGPGQSGAGSWEFPGGKIEPDESDEQALMREILEELNLEIAVQSFLGAEDHRYPFKTIHLRVYRVLWVGGDLILREHDCYRWCLPEEICVDELSPADRPFVRKLRQ